MLSDDVVDPGLLDGAVVDDMERSLELRRCAQKAFIEHNAKEALKKITHSRGHPPQEFTAGDYVYVYRVPRLKKRRHEVGPRSQETTPNRASWIGPGTLLVVDGASLWVSMFGELWRVAREQCRVATNVEKQGVEAALDGNRELIEEYKRSSQRKGYKDLRAEQWPEGEDERREIETDELDAAHPEHRQLRFEERPDLEEYEPTTPLERQSVADIEEAEDREMDVGPSRATTEEPEAEHSRRESERSEEPTRGSREAVHREERESETERQERRRVPTDRVGGVSDEEYAQRIGQSEAMSRRLDSLPPPGQPLRTRTRRHGWDPYFQEFCFVTPEEEEELEAEQADREDEKRWHLLAKMGRERPKRDYWELCTDRGVLIRHHVQKRRALFSPSGVKSTPVPIRQIQRNRVTFLTQRDGKEERREEDEWSTQEGKRSQGIWWTGRTEFQIQKEEQKRGETLEVWVTDRKNSDEVDLIQEPAEAQEGWRLADAAEWEKIRQSGAVKILSIEESQRVKTQLAKEGKIDRILPTRMLRRYKPAEQPNEPPTKKSRLCIRGDKDPDIYDLERFSPTVSTMNLNAMLQVAVNEAMEVGIGDLKNAFCQSQPLVRRNGPLYFKQPKEGISGLHPDQIVLIVAGCYGLVDAPLHWRKSLVATLKSLGYKESNLDPCIYKLYESGRLAGMIAVEVDDLLSCGSGIHLKKMEQLRTIYSFGKWVDLRKSPQGAAFNGRRLRQAEDGTLLIDMCKFVQERLEEIPMAKGRKSQRKEQVTEEERSQARAVCGSLNWLSKEGRPDAAGHSSLMSSRLTRMVVEDLVQLNDVVKNLKESPDLTIKIQPLKDMQLAVITDASFGNDGFH